jgi:hypothetical protein
MNNYEELQEHKGVKGLMFRSDQEIRALGSTKEQSRKRSTKE